MIGAQARGVNCNESYGLFAGVGQKTVEDVGCHIVPKSVPMPVVVSDEQLIACDAARIELRVEIQLAKLYFLGKSGIHFV